MLERTVSAAILLGIAAGLVGVAYVKSGLFDVAASHPHSRAIEWITHETMINSIKRRAPDVALPKLLSTKGRSAAFASMNSIASPATAPRQ